MEFKDRLKELRESLNLNKRELSDKVKFSPSIISMYEAGERRPSIENLECLADFFNVDIDYLLGNTDYTTRLSWENETMNLPSNITKLTKLKKIPILGTIACVSPIFAEENIDGYFVADNNIKADFTLRAKGDSMIDIGIHDGDLVFLRQQPVLDNGEVGAVLIDNEATLKKVYINKNEMILQPCNKNYPPMVIKDKDIKITGKLVGFYHNMDK